MEYSSTERPAKERRLKEAAAVKAGRASEGRKLIIVTVVPPLHHSGLL